MSDSRNMPLTLCDAMNRIPESYHEVYLVRETGLFRFTVKKLMGAGELRITSGTHPSWQQAFEELWRTL